MSGGDFTEEVQGMREHVEDGLENALEAVKRLFTGDHDGKLLVRVSPEP